MNKKLTLLILIVTLAGCNSTSTKESAPPSISPPSTLTPFPTITPSPIPTITPSPANTPTPTFPPYTHEPFSIVFFRDWNLWIANIGERTIERQLTFEPPEIHITNYALSPDRTRIVYTAFQFENPNALIKLVNISTGEIEVILGENDPYVETNVFWIDDTKIAYKNWWGIVSTFETENVEELTTYIIYDLVSNKQIEITEYESISQSPNGRYWLTCTGFIVCKYTLHDLSNGNQREIEGSLKWGGFISWSPDSKYMLFTTRDSEVDDCTSQLVMIDTETLQEKFITPEDKNVWEASISSSSEILVYKQDDITDFNMCKGGSHNYWLVNIINNEAKMIPASFDYQTTWGVQWAPDSKRLIFFYTGYRGYDLWSMNLDGSNLDPLLANVMDYRDYKIINLNP